GGRGARVGERGEGGGDAAQVALDRRVARVRGRGVAAGAGDDVGREEVRVGLACVAECGQRGEFALEAGQRPGGKVIVRGEVVGSRGRGALAFVVHSWLRI